MASKKLKTDITCKPPCILNGFLVFLTLFIFFFPFISPAFSKTKNISSKTDPRLISEALEQTENFKDSTSSHSQVNSLNLDSKHLESQKDAPSISKVEKKGKINLKALKKITADEIRSNILRLTPQSITEAQSLGWPAKPLTTPAPIENMIKAAPNELQSLTRPEKKDTINKINITGKKDTYKSYLTVTPEYLTFFAKPDQTPQNQTLKIKNRGTGTLNYSLSESVSWLSLDSAGGALTTGENIIIVSINTAGLTETNNPYTGEIIISNNDDGTDKEYIRVKLYLMTADGFITTNSCDANGNIVRKVDADGNIIDYEYDQANRMIKIIYPNANSVVFEYDKNGKKTKTVDKTGIAEYVYDSFNRLVAVCFQETAWIIYRYDLNGNVKQLIYPDGKEVNYVYDGDNRLTQVNYESNSTMFTATYAYDSTRGNLISRTLPNGTITTYLYNNTNIFTDCVNKDSTGQLISSYHYTFDANGNKTGVTETTPQGSNITTYEYDELNRLTKTVYPDGTQNLYTYDEIGNRLTKTADSKTLTYHYDNDNRLIQTEDEIFIYDKRGNLIKTVSQEKIIEYTHDYDDRLIRYDDGTNTVEYEYNGDGLRLSKTVNGKKTIFINDIRTPITQILMECTGNWYITKRYMYGKDLISQEVW